MSTFTINFQANTTGIHHVGYRTYNDPVDTYTVIDVNVITTGPQEVTITIPGNLYCATEGITYNGYLIAACQDQTDADLDGIPDLALMWTILIPQEIDACLITEIKCSSLPIFSAELTSSTAPYTPDGTYSLVITEVNPGDEVAPATIAFEINSGVIEHVTVVDGGAYKVLPTVNMPVTITGDPAVFTIALTSGCPTLLLTDYMCTTNVDLSEDSEYDLGLSDSVTICVDTNKLADLPVLFTATPEGACHCYECKNVVIDATDSGTPGSGRITYQTCWDASNPYGAIVMISRIINFNDIINLGCILPDTMIIEQGTLIAPPNPIITACS